MPLASRKWLLPAIGTVLVAAAIVVAILASSGGGGGSRTLGAAPGGRGATKGLTDDPSSAYEAAASAALPSVVQIQRSDGLGSGIVFDKQGDIVTNAHVVAGEKRFVVVAANGTAIRARRCAARSRRATSRSRPSCRRARRSTPATAAARSSTCTRGWSASRRSQRPIPSSAHRAGRRLCDLEQRGQEHRVAARAERPRHAQRPRLPRRRARLAEPGRRARRRRPEERARGEGRHQAGRHHPSVDGAPVGSVDDLATALAAQKPGDRVRVKVVHQNGKTQTVDVTLGRLPAG